MATVTQVFPPEVGFAEQVEAGSWVWGQLGLQKGKFFYLKEVL